MKARMVWGVKKENVGQFADLFSFSRKLNRQQSPIDVWLSTTLYGFDELSFQSFIRYSGKYHWPTPGGWRISTVNFRGVRGTFVCVFLSHYSNAFQLSIPD